MGFVFFYKKGYLNIRIKGESVMSHIQRISTIIELDRIIEQSPMGILLFKHSTICPISQHALSQVEQFVQQTGAMGINIGMVFIRENRDVSNEIERRYQVPHQSPQIILIKNHSVLWQASHWAITKNSIEAEVRKITG
jgi:bacillithiol system protein YtxJ